MNFDRTDQSDFAFNYASDPNVGQYERKLPILEEQLSRLDGVAARFGRNLNTTLTSAIQSGSSLENVLQRLQTSLSGLVLDAAFQPLEALVRGGISSLFGGFANLNIKKFAKGGIVNTSSLFAHGGGLGIAGEAGPEAILPLRRASDGSLGVASTAGKAINIVINLSNPTGHDINRSSEQIAVAAARAIRRVQSSV